jgi:WD40 repeat protein/tRNA A-37 threonylcarbamoyl transferase component Bud32
MPDSVSSPSAAALANLLAGRPVADTDALLRRLENPEERLALARALAADAPLAHLLCRQAEPADLRLRALLAELRLLLPAEAHSGDSQTAPVEAAHAANTPGGAPPSASSLPPRLGNYRLLHLLGQGGMGAVYLAEDEQLCRQVALKVIRPDASTSASSRERFLREARAAAAIEHDNIVAIYHVGEDQGIPFLAMPLLRGESLEDRLRRAGGPLPLAEVLHVGRHVALGLSAAHQRGLLHRDIKPANVFLEGDPAGGSGALRAKILDFGLARPVKDDAHLTQSGTVVGTPAYIAPEQARGKAVDCRADLFSLGCVLYRMATGRLPFKGSDAMSTLMSLALDVPRPPREINPHLPVALERLIVRLLAKDPQERPPAAFAVARALELMAEVPTPAGAAAPPPLAIPVTVTAAPMAVPTATPLPAPLPPVAPVAARPPAPAEPSNVWSVVTAVDEAQHAKRRATPARQLWVMAGIATVGSLLLLGVLGLIFLRNGKTPSVSDAGEGTARLEAARPRAAKVIQGTVGQPVMARLEPAAWRGPGPLDLLDRGKIPAVDRFAWQPDELVAVVSEHRQRFHGEVSRVLSSADGRTIAAFTRADRTLRLLDGKTLRERAAIQNVSPGSPALLADGKRALIHQDKGLRLWDVSGEEPVKGLHFPLGKAYFAALSTPDGKTVVTQEATGDSWSNGKGPLSVWDLSGDRPVLRCTVQDAGPTSSGHWACLSDDGGTLAVQNSKREVRLWGVLGKEPRARGMVRADARVAWQSEPALSPDGKVLALLVEPDVLRLWDVSGVTPKKQLDFAVPGNMVKPVFSADGKTLAILRGDDQQRGIDVRDLSTDGAKKRLVLSGAFVGSVGTVALSSDGKVLVTGSITGVVQAWDVSGARALPRAPLQGHDGPVSSLTFAPDGKRLAAGLENGEVWLWRVDVPAPQLHAMREAKKTRAGLDPQAVTFTEDGTGLVSTASYRTPPIAWLDVTDAQMRSRAPLPTDSIWSSSDGKRWVGVYGGQVVVWDVQGTRFVMRGKLAKPAFLRGFAPDGSTFLLQPTWQECALLDVSAVPPRERGRWAHGFRDGSVVHAFSGDNQTLFVGGDDILQAWDLSGPQPRSRSLLRGVKVGAVAPAPEGKTVAVLGEQSGKGVLLQLLEAASGKRLRQWQWPGMTTTALAFAPDGRHLAVGNRDGTAYVLRLAAPPK